MIIDKTTGKGCAWSIVSKKITSELIAEGITDQPIFRIPCKDGYELLRVVSYDEGQMYVTPQRSEAQAEELLWAPSFLDRKVWKRAVSRFKAYERLDRNIEKYLLPEMGEHIQSIPEPELISITRTFLIGHGVLHTPICQHAGKTYYFNENEIYSLDKRSEQFAYEKRLKFNLFQVRYETCFNMVVWRKAVSHFKVGMTLRECIKLFLKTELTHSVARKMSPVDQLVQYIAPPGYERAPGNRDESTFDRIRITVGLPCRRFPSWEDLRDEVKKHQSEIYRRVVRHLERDRRFRKYGVPVSLFRLSNVMLLHDFSMEFIFELNGQKPGLTPAAPPSVGGKSF